MGEYRMIGGKSVMVAGPKLREQALQMARQTLAVYQRIYGIGIVDHPEVAMQKERLARIERLGE